MMLLKGRKVSEKTKGQIYYELRMEGLDNIQIAERYNTTHLTVGSRICEYRKANNLPSPPRPKRKKIAAEQPKEKNATKLIEDAQKIRDKMNKKVYRRSDGVLQCPVAYAEGYGI